MAIKEELGSKLAGQVAMVLAEEVSRKFRFIRLKRTFLEFGVEKEWTCCSFLGLELTRIPGGSSMSTSLVYHGFGVRDYRYERTDYRGGAAVFRIRPRENLIRCLRCGGSEVTRHGGVWRDFRSLPLGSKPVWLQCFIPRVKCSQCNITRQIKIGFAPSKCRYTKPFERYVLELGRRMTIEDVARHLGISWDTVKGIQKRDLHRRFSKPKLKHLKRIAIDEIAVAKGHRYQTLVLDLDSGARSEEHTSELQSH